MSHHIEDLLAQWKQFPKDDWVLAVITNIQGSSYRKTGAMMLFHALGKSIGLVSGGCLEGDLLRHAQRSLQQDQAINVTYDASDESDASHQLGCGGIVDLLLIPVTPNNNYLHLETLRQQLQHGQCEFHIPLVKTGTPSTSVNTQVVPTNAQVHDPKASFINPSDSQVKTLAIPFRPRFHLAIFGGGLDAQPLAKLALQLGWAVSVFDQRSSYAHPINFVDTKIIKDPISSLPSSVLNKVDAVVVMQHNLGLDALAIKLIASNSPAYIALLGPRHRRDQVFAKANVSLSDFSGYFSAPAGFDIGGELPESIALSILAESHALLHGKLPLYE
ncbi:XdhC family protein [Psychromonas sp. KJ10-2]|uniref:XdhC family protein n=1 Tax=Psychromonas sp. KJ10-2 TaxID=3391822 RepID=UPI0039B63157